MSQTYFQFNNKIYKQDEGTAMGNSLSPFMANLFMGKFETDLKQDLDYFPRLWLRYVDDVFAILDTSKFTLQEFTDILNSKFPSIKFTNEIEKNGTLPFLDTLVIRNRNKLEIDIYRKNTNTDRYITSDSNHSMQHKRSALNFLVHRLLNFPLSKTNYRKEFLKIKEIAAYNGFSETLVTNLIRKCKLRLSISKITTLGQSNNKVVNKYVKLPNFPAYTKGLNKIMSKFDLKIVTSSNNSLSNYLGNPKDPVDMHEKSGIYKISCKDCNQVYVGQTKRNLKTRYKEHLADIKYKRFDKSSVALHMLENNHKVDDIKLIKKVDNKRELDCFESMEIFKNRKLLMNNDSQGPLVNSILFKLLKQPITETKRSSAKTS